MSKFIFVTGGVCSSLGKGVAASSIASLLENVGLSVAMMKCDPYINVDARNMSPFQHGEVYVTDDGAETDLDLGNYARFTKNVSLSAQNSVTTGKIYNAVIENERNGLYKGRTVQVIPHITDEIKRRMLLAAQKNSADVLVVEIGGTVGDIECIPFLEAARQLIREKGRGNAICVHLTLIPAVTGGELKTKPTQHSVKVLQQAGIQPDILLCRCEREIDEALRKKIGLFCNLKADDVFSSIDVNGTVYELPVSFNSQGLDAKILQKLGLGDAKTDVSCWKAFLSKFESAEKKVKIALVCAKGDLSDCYKSVHESLFDAAVSANSAKLDFVRICADDLAQGGLERAFASVQGIVVANNCGQRGFLGALNAVEFARKNKIPYLGIGFGMHLMAIEFARNILLWQDADSSEFVEQSEHLVVSLPDEQEMSALSKVFHIGAEKVILEGGSLCEKIYKKREILERHRNKYRFNGAFESAMSEGGMVCAGRNADCGMAEVFEWRAHPFGIGVQFHPEFVSKPMSPHPLFSAFVAAALESSSQTSLF